MVPRPRLFHWRTVSGSEIDFVLEQGRRLVAVETKYTGATRYADTRNLRTFLDEYPETAAGVLVYDGREIVRPQEKIVAVPWSALV